MIVPFRGSAEDGRAALGRLARLRLGPDDELLIVDNTDAGLPVLRESGGPSVLHAPERASAYHARNTGARAARGEWLLFVDADCRPEEGLIDAYFQEAPTARCGALAGAILPVAGQSSLAARHARAHRRLDQADNLRHPHKPMAVTANLLVRRAAWSQLGGFCGHVRAGADSEFCWRLQEEGWMLGYRPAAVVHHYHRATVAALLRQVARDAAGSAWLERQRPGCCPPPRLVGDGLRSVAAALSWGLLGQGERAALRALDALVVCAERSGRLLGNVAPERYGPRGRASGT